MEHEKCVCVWGWGGGGVLLAHVVTYKDILKDILGWFLLFFIFLHNWYNKARGMYYLICGKGAYTIIEKNRPCVVK